MTNLNEVSYYLGMKIDIKKERTTIHQITYLQKTLKKFSFNNCKSCKILMNSETVSHMKDLKE